MKTYQVTEKLYQKKATKYTTEAIDLEDAIEKVVGESSIYHHTIKYAMNNKEIAKMRDHFRRSVFHGAFRSYCRRLRELEIKDGDDQSGFFNDNVIIMTSYDNKARIYNHNNKNFKITSTRSFEKIEIEELIK